MKKHIIKSNKIETKIDNITEGIYNKKDSSTFHDFSEFISCSNNSIKVITSPTGPGEVHHNYETNPSGTPAVIIGNKASDTGSKITGQIIEDGLEDSLFFPMGDSLHSEKSAIVSSELLTYPNETIDRIPNLYQTNLSIKNKNDFILSNPAFIFGSAASRNYDENLNEFSKNYLKLPPNKKNWMFSCNFSDRWNKNTDNPENVTLLKSNPLLDEIGLQITEPKLNSSYDTALLVIPITGWRSLPSDTYTFSTFLRTEEDLTVNVGICLLNNSSSAILFDNIDTKKVYVTKKNEWMQISISKNLLFQNGASNGEDYYILLRFHRASSSIENHIKVAGLQLEKGIDPSPYDSRYVSYSPSREISFKNHPLIFSFERLFKEDLEKTGIMYSRKIFVNKKDTFLDTFGKISFGYKNGEIYCNKENTIINHGQNISNFEKKWERVFILKKEDILLIKVINEDNEYYELSIPYSVNDFQAEYKSFKFNLLLGGKVDENGKMINYNGYYKNLNICSKDSFEKKQLIEFDISGKHKKDTTDFISIFRSENLNEGE